MSIRSGPEHRCAPWRLTLVQHCRNPLLRAAPESIRGLCCPRFDVARRRSDKHYWQLLNPSSDAEWTHHVAGSAQMVQARSPRGFKDEFEKSLFAGHVGAAVSEAFLNRSHCQYHLLSPLICLLTYFYLEGYLAQPEWVELYKSLILDTEYLTDRSELVSFIRATY